MNLLARLVATTGTAAMSRPAPIAIVALSLFAVSVPVAAAPTLNISGGKLIGASGVDVGGTLYDVEFVDGSCVSLFSGCDSNSDFQFTSYSAGLAASQALLDSVFVRVAAGDFDAFPSLTRGCSYAVQCIVRTPTNLNPFNSAFVEGAVALNWWGTLTDPAPSGLEVSINEDTGAFDTFGMHAWARWTRAAPVPVPGTLALLGLGLATLAGSRRRHG